MLKSKFYWILQISGVTQFLNYASNKKIHGERIVITTPSSGPSDSNLKYVVIII